MHWRQARDLRTLNLSEPLFDFAEHSIEDDARAGDNPQIQMIMTLKSLVRSLSPIAADSPTRQLLKVRGSSWTAGARQAPKKFRK